MATKQKSPRDHNFSRLYNIMAKHPEACCMILALVFVGLSKYAKSFSAGKSVYQTQPSPARFFPQYSVVVDFPYGNLADVGQLLQDEEVLFIMYYAPWCASSQRVRQEYEKAAKYLEHEVTFVAVNCWYPLGSCRQQNNFFTFPVFFFYHSYLDGFRYNGITTAEHIVDFVLRFLYPITPLYNHHDITRFISKNNHAVIGFFDFNDSPQPPGYQQYYYASLRILEKSPKNKVEFGLITNYVTAYHFQSEINSSSVFYVNVRNVTKKYPAEKNLTASALILWIQLNKGELASQWILPSGVKSLTLSKEIDKGPALILFTPLHPLLKINQYYSLLHEVALKYHSCENNTDVVNAVDGYRQYKWETISSHLQLTQECRPKNRERSHQDSSSHYESFIPVVQKCCISMVLEGFEPSKYNSCDVCVNYYSESSYSCQKLMSSTSRKSSLFRPFDLSLNECLVIVPNYNPNEYLSMCCDNDFSPLKLPRKKLPSVFSFPPSPPSSTQQPSVVSAAPATHPSQNSRTPLHEHSDPYVKWSVKNQHKKKCQKLRRQRLNKWSPTYDYNNLGFEGPSANSAYISGMGCNTNKSLTFLAMDTRESSEFAQSLGFNIKLRKSESLLVLVDAMNENHFVLEESITRSSIESFVYNFTHGYLNRYLRTVDSQQKPCEGDVCIVEVTTATFQDVVVNNDKDVVLLYHAPWCGFCVGLAHVFLSLARYFRSSKDLLFARVNGYTNDLPWEFTVDNYPTIHMYPAHRKDDSVAFPDHLEKTLPNLIQFILRYGASTLKLETGLSICSKACIQNNLDSSNTNIQILKNNIKQLRGGLAAMRRSLHKLEVLLEPSDDSSQTRDRHTQMFVQMKILQDYIAVLKRRLRRREMQLQSAQKLNSALQTGQNSLIEKDKLSAIVNNFKDYQEQVRLQLMKEISAKSLGGGSHVDKTTQKHDEL